MKNLLAVFFIVTFCPLTSKAQNFKEKTNAVRISTSETIGTTSLPYISWISPQFASSNSDENKVYLEAAITSKAPFEEIQLVISEMGKDDIIKPYADAKGKLTYRITQPITLRDGQYRISIIAQNVNSGEVSAYREMNIGMNAVSAAVSMNRKDRAILFATDKYDYWNDLVNPIFDANSIAEIIKVKYGFEVEVIENPTQEDVFLKLADYSQIDYNPQDQLMVFFAGHGFFDETFGEGYVVATNSLENDRAKTTFISHSRLRSIINNISCEHILLTMDVCFGGTFDPVIASQRSIKKTVIEDEAEFLVRKLSYKTRKYLTSGGKTYVSDGVRGQHSPFAQKLIKALNEGKGMDEILTLGEIKPYVEKLIPEPRMGSFGDDNNASDFIFVEAKR